MKGTFGGDTIMPEDPHEAKTITPDTPAAPKNRRENHPTPDLRIGQQLGMSTKRVMARFAAERRVAGGYVSLNCFRTREKRFFSDR